MKFTLEKCAFFPFTRGCGQTIITHVVKDGVICGQVQFDAVGVRVNTNDMLQTINLDDPVIPMLKKVLAGAPLRKALGEQKIVLDICHQIIGRNWDTLFSEQ